MVKRTGAKYEAIMDAAIRVIAQHGYFHSQVSKIAREAKVADGTIYLYFKNKEDLLLSLFKEKMGAFISMIENRIQDQTSPTIQLHQLIFHHLSYLESDPDLAVVTQVELRQSDPKLRKEINQVLKRYVQIIDHIIEQGKKMGDFRNDLDIRIARRMIFGTIDETVTSWVMDDGKYSLSEQTEAIHHLFVKGMGT